MNSPWYNQTGIGLSDKGTAYIERAFRWAHEADPQALLSYNEAEGEGLKRKSDAIDARVKDFKPRGVPIDGVGVQLHVSQPDLDTAPIAANIARLTPLDLQVHITELDVSLPLDSRGQAQSSDRLGQAEVYGGIVRVCLQSPGCTAIQTGDSPTNTRGSAPIPTAHAGRHFLLTAPASPNRLTTP
ncbi:MAG TPA: endo-1,4-beta-xylanase [Candidatus Sulfotelmatobacter sp.]